MARSLGFRVQGLGLAKQIQVYTARHLRLHFSWVLGQEGRARAKHQDVVFYNSQLALRRSASCMGIC